MRVELPIRMNTVYDFVDQIDLFNVIPNVVSYLPSACLDSWGSEG